MNTSERSLPSTPQIGFGLIAGSLAGLLLAVEVNVLRVLIWRIGADTGTEAVDMLHLSMKNAALTVQCFCAVGFIVGFLAALWIPHNRFETNQFLRRMLPFVWLLVSLQWVVWGELPVIGGARHALFAFLLTLALAWVSYDCWRKTLRWLLHGHFRRVLFAIAATGLVGWIPFVVYIVLL
jgi:hypothetical protein